MAMNKNMTILLIVILVSQFMEQVSAEPTVVSFSSSKWYLWDASGSDTCLLWLGGGTVFRDHLVINPYDLESLNTRRYLQDLGTRYRVLVLREGPSRDMPGGVDYDAKSSLLHDARGWMRTNDCVFAYVIGYSIGGMAVGYELALRNQEDWTTPNGAILITVPMDWQLPFGALQQTSFLLRSNLLLIYANVGDNSFWDQGLRYYENAPRHHKAYHKEWYLLDGYEHEVFTKLDTGAYDPKAYHITVSFIERSKALMLRELMSGALEFPK